MEKITGLIRPQLCSAAKVSQALPVREVPESDGWRIGLLDKLLMLRRQKYLRVEDNQRITAMIESLCST